MLQYIDHQLEHHYAVLRPHELEKDIRSALAWNKLTPAAMDVMVVLINTLAHKILETAAKHRGRVDWPYAADSGILDPLHRIKELAPHNFPAQPTDLVIFRPATIQRWLTEHQKRTPTLRCNS